MQGPDKTEALLHRAQTAGKDDLTERELKDLRELLDAWDTWKASGRFGKWAIWAIVTAGAMAAALREIRNGGFFGS